MGVGGTFTPDWRDLAGNLPAPKYIGFQLVLDERHSDPSGALHRVRIPKTAYSSPSIVPGR